MKVMSVNHFITFFFISLIINMRHYFLRSALLFSLCSSALATNLQDVLHYALRQDPKLLEAQAEQDVALQTRKASEALHYPTLTLVSTQQIAQYHQYEEDQRRKTDIGLQGRLNIYSWGGIEASVKRDSLKERAAYYQFFAIREELGNLIATHYINAIHMLESLEVAKRNLQRHQKFLHDLQIIKTYDIGRESEYTQAHSRYLSAESNIIELERNLQTTMSSLNLYTGKPLSTKDLVDPFKGVTAEKIIKHYHSLDFKSHPSVLAQEATRDSTEADIEVTKAATKPQINLDGMASQQDRNLAISLSWDLFNRPANYNAAQATAKLHSASAKTDQIKRDIKERYETMQINMKNSQRQAQISQQHRDVQAKVASNYAEQFTVSRRSLLEVLDAYADLARIESTHINAKHQFRKSALDYLLAQAKIASWAGLPENL